MPAVTAPRVAKFSQSAVTQWSDGTNFTGFCLIGIVPPTTGGTDFSFVSFGDNFPAQRLPVWAIIPIKNGYFDSDLGLFYTTDIEPPAAKYIAYYYDSTGRQIAGPTAQFTVTSDPVTPPSATLTVPTTGTAPTPN